jgi:hypothetical protein
LKKVDIRCRYHLDLLELLPFGGFFAYFDLAGLNSEFFLNKQGINGRNMYCKVSVGFLVQELAIPARINISPMDSSSMRW